jgi:DNA-binding MarR family transcriptional regulator
MNQRPTKKDVSETQLFLDALRRIVRSLRNFSKFTEKEYGLSTAQIYVLQKLVEAITPLSINELATATLTHQSSVSVVVSKLVDRKLVERITNKDDSRSVKLTISKQGEYLLSKSPTSMQERLMRGLGKMTTEQRHGLVLGLQALLKNAGLEDEKAGMLFEEDQN